MEQETLLTFNFDAPHNISQVELLGSWDNFTHAYAMQHDRRRGPTHWTGCFRFTHIVYDGRSPSFTPPRNGGLRQGGRYWYFYRLDDSTEAYDATRDVTSVCPLLPGQLMNIIEVPVEAKEEVLRPRSDSGVFDTSDRAFLSFSYQYTLDPATKYKPLSPPGTRSRARCFTYSGGEEKKCSSKMAVDGSDCRPERPGLRTQMRRSGARTSSQMTSAETEAHTEHVSRRASAHSSSDSCVQQPELENDCLGRAVTRDDSFDQASTTTDLTRPPRLTDEAFSADGGTIVVLSEDTADCRPAAAEGTAKGVIVSTREVVDVWERSLGIQSRSSRDADRCYRVDIPQELAWATPRKSLVESLHQVRRPVVS